AFGVVGPSLAALGRGRPGSVRVAELALAKLVQPVLLRPQQLELVGALVGLDLLGRRLPPVTGLGAPARTAALTRAGLTAGGRAADPAPDEAHVAAGAFVCDRMNWSVSVQARSAASANSAAFRSKKLCGASGSTTIRCSTPASVSARSNAWRMSSGIAGSAPPKIARSG